MENVLKIQTDQLTQLKKIEKLEEHNRVIQLGELYEQRRIDEDGDRVEKQLINLNDQTKKNHDNVVKLFKDIDKSTKSFAKDVKNLTMMSGEQAKDITDKATGRRQFKTIGDRVTGVKENVKDFFTLRGFLDKTGVSKRGSGGIFSEYLDRREERQKYVKAREEVDPQYVRMVGKDKARETFANQFNKQQQIQRSMTKNEKRITELSEMGFDEKAIGRTGRYKERLGLATELAKVDTRVRPEGFDVKTGKIKTDSEAPAARQAKEEKQSNVLSFASAKEGSDESEAAMEQSRIQGEQLEILKQIEENTRGGGRRDASPVKVTDEGGIGSMLSGLLGNITSFLGKGFMSAIKLIFNPKNILKFVTKIFAPVMIIGSLINGIMDGFKAFAETGSIGEALIAGLGGVLSFLTFGLFDAETIRGVVDFVSNAVDEYIIQPIKNFIGFIGDAFNTYIKEPIMAAFEYIGGLFDEYIVQPLQTIFQPVADFFTKIKEQVFGFLEDFGIPEIGFTIPIINKKVSIGPFYPFRPEAGTDKISSSETLKESSTTSASGTSEDQQYQQNITNVNKDSTQVLVSDDKTKLKDGQVVSRSGGDRFLEFDAKTGKSVYNNAEKGVFDKEISKSAFQKIKSKARSEGGIGSEEVDTIIARDEAYQKLSFADKMKVTILGADPIKLAAAGNQSGNAVAAQSAENDAAKQKASAGGNTVVAPTTNVSNNSNSTFAVKAPVRNPDASFNRYAEKAYA